jgi:hypothetical protein
MLASILKALGALGSIAGLLRALATGFMGLFIFRKGAEAQAAQDTAADNRVLQAETKAALAAPKTTDETVDRLRRAGF